MTTKPIAPVFFKAFPEDAWHSREEPYVECFNTGLGEDDIASLTASHEDSKLVVAAGALIVLGLFPLAMGINFLFFGILATVIFHPDHETSIVPGIVTVSILPGFGVSALGAAWWYFLMSPFHPQAKAWKQALAEAWLTHGGQIIVLKDVPKSVRLEVTDDLCKLEEIRRGLNRLDPVGDELDDARDALLRYIEASDIPLLGKRAAAATHIKDRAVRQAAKEYERALQVQGFTRKRVDLAIDAAKSLLGSRRQERTDADLIKRVHQL